MRTVDFSTILFESLQVAGQDRHSISTQTFAQFRDFANARMRYAWDVFNWPDIVKIVEISPTEVDGVTQYPVPADAEQVLHVYINNPLATTVVKELTFRIYQDGDVSKLIFLTNPTTAFLEYKIARPVISGSAWDSSIPYYVGSQCYFDSGSNTGSVIALPGKPHKGNFYNCIVNANIGESPFTHPHKWEKVNIPYFLTSYIPRAVLSDWLRSEMQFDLAQATEQEAEFVLGEEIGKITKTQGQVERLNFHNTY